MPERFEKRPILSSPRKLRTTIGDVLITAGRTIIGTTEIALAERERKRYIAGVVPAEACTNALRPVLVSNG
jgi:hypothetical protein